MTELFDLPRSTARRFALIALGLSFVAIGVAHFTNADFFVATMTDVPTTG